jgi:hypothetical protein
MLPPLHEANTRRIGCRDSERENSLKVKQDTSGELNWTTAETQHLVTITSA